MENYEKLGAFYLGRRHDLDKGQSDDRLLLYDSKDLTTHALCVGMTGSGKTGLCLSLIEEAAIDGVPALVIDPKGDLGNLLLTFPELRGEDFLPWVNEDDARRKGRTVEEHARQQAAMWKEGLASWGQDGDRIRRLREAADFSIYTPGSEAGLPISILGSFSAPPEAVRSDGDLLRDRVGSTASSLLGLMGIDADPIRSREHILISTLLDHTWRQGTSLDLAGLIQAIQSPPVERVGVMDLDSFFPAKDRFDLAMQLNGLLAAPGFHGWLTGQPLDIQQLLYTPSGKPRISIFSIAHLSDAERMFFVSLLFNETLAWMRSRPGTSSLRALLYMDEIFGYVPPTAEPPSKRPLLTLLKQARAYGLGVVLATQNPVDLDYKGLSNIGTWFLGRLQTERDKVRIMDGLEAAGPSTGNLDKRKLEKIISGLGSRIFLMRNVHEDEPVVFETRWAMSYLRGPLTRQQIKRAMSGRPETAGVPPAPGADVPRNSAKAAVAAEPRPVLPPDIPEVFLPQRKRAGGGLQYQPNLVGMARIQYLDSRTRQMKHAEEITLLLPLSGTDLGVDWLEGRESDLRKEDLEIEPEPEAVFESPPPGAAKAASYTKWRRALGDALYRNRRCELWSSPTLGLVSEPEETEGEFRIRLSDMARERRDNLAAKLRDKYGARVQRLEERIRRAEQSVQKEKEQVSGQTVQTAISFGTTVLSALLGRKRMSLRTLGRATTTARGVGRTVKEKQDVARASENLKKLREQMRELDDQLESELEMLERSLNPRTEDLETVSLRPRRSDVEIRLVALAWAPHGRGSDGSIEPLWD